MEIKLIFDNHFTKAVWDLIMNAKQSIDICSYKVEPLDLKKKNKVNIILEAILLKKKQGVDVRLLLNKEQPIRGVSRYNMATASFFRGKDIICRYLNNFRCCHSKIILVDDYSFYIGSHNLSNKALTSNFEAGIIHSDKILGLDIRRRFDDLWTTARDFT
jgi:phosphatidylserine/phosphatidylglycerophosphate/cardiolipin synthase-like enzyme